MRRALMVVGLLVAAVASEAFGFVHFSEFSFDGHGSKWDDRTIGTPANVTWGFVPDGTGMHESFDIDGGFEDGDGVDGTSSISSLRSAVDAAHGSGAFDAAIQSALNTWSVATGGRLTFQQVADPGALPLWHPDAASVNGYPDIRISAFMPDAGHSFANAGAVGFGPPGDDLNFPDSVAGDIIFNLGAGFTIAPGAEGDPYDIFPPGGGLFQNELESLFLHELGHAAIGLGHPATGPGVVMYVGEGSIGFINRRLHADDIAGARYAYGLGLLLGDFNRDGIISGLDIQKFIDAFTNEAQYKADYALSDAEFLMMADLNDDDVFSGLDIDPFVDLLTGGGASANQLALLQSIPEPGVAAMICAVLSGTLLRGHRPHRPQQRPFNRRKS